MKKTRTLALLLLLVPGPAQAAEISQYTTNLRVDPDGAGHAVCTLVIVGGSSETVEIPLSHGAWTNFRLAEASEGLLLEPPQANSGTIRVTLPAATTAPSRLTFAFDIPGAFAKAENAAPGVKLTIPHESRTLRYAFVNTQVTLIKDFRMLVTLPEGYRFQAIREQLPRQTKSEVEPRVRLGGEGGRQNALLKLSNLKQGDDTSMLLEALPARRSLLWLVAGVALSGLYLVRFRDLVARNKE
jgi:hypothetical protein